MKRLIPIPVRRQLWPAYYFAQAALRAPAIRRFDRRVRPGTSLWENGYKKYPQIPDGLLDRVRPLEPGAPVVIDDHRLPVFTWLFDQARTDIVAYLGPAARVDNISVSRIEEGTGLENVSGSWHEDSVGHRLKLFLCLEGSGDVPTAVIAGSNQKRYFPKLSDFYRFKGLDDFAEVPGQVLLRHHTGDCTLFDTNARHRGVYDKHHRARKLLEIELADRDKSNRFNCKTAIGPGNTSAIKFLIDRKIADAHARDLLLDPALFNKKADGLYLYG